MTSIRDSLRLLASPFETALARLLRVRQSGAVEARTSFPVSASC